MPLSVEWQPQQYRAAADGRTLDTAAFQAAIDAAHAAGGGTVRVVAGRYLLGTLDLRSNVRLQLDRGAVLLGSPHIADYRRGNWPALIKARGQQHIAITGEGTIDGQGRQVAEDTLRIGREHTYLELFPGLKPGETVPMSNESGEAIRLDPWSLQRAGRLGDTLFHTHSEGTIYRAEGFVRPQVLEFWQCQDVQVSGVTLRDSCSWVETYRECEDVHLEGIKVRSTAYWNNDGMDIVDCHRVRIEHCDIDAADDGICLKSEDRGHRCEDIEIDSCRIRSSASAFKLGTGSYGGFRHIRVNHLEVYDTYRSAVALESVDGGDLEDIEVTGVIARHTGNAFFIRLGHRVAAAPAGILRRVVLADFQVEIPADRPDAGYNFPGPPPREHFNPLPSSVVGIADHAVEDITLRNIVIDYPGGGRRAQADVPLTRLRNIPEKEEAYPEYSMFGELPAWGLYVRHAEGVRIENVSLRLKAHDFRSAIVADEVRGLTLDRVQVKSAGEEPAIVLRKVSGEQVQRLDLAAEIHEAIRRLAN